jgi:hypothetical protein
MGHSALRCLARRSALPLDRGDDGRRGMPPGHQGQATEPTKSAMHQASRACSAYDRGWLVGRLRLGLGHASTVGQIPPPWARGRTRLPPRGRLLPASGRLFGLFQDSAEVVGAAADPSEPAEGGGAAAYHPPGTVDAAAPCRRDRSPGRPPAGSSLGARQARRCPQQAMARRRASTRERWCGWAIPPRLPPCASARHGWPGRRHRGRLGRASPGGVELVEESAWILLC